MAHIVTEVARRNGAKILLLSNNLDAKSLARFRALLPNCVMDFAGCDEHDLCAKLGWYKDDSCDPCDARRTCGSQLKLLLLDPARVGNPPNGAASDAAWAASAGCHRRHRADGWAEA